MIPLRLLNGFYFPLWSIKLLPSLHSKIRLTSLALLTLLLAACNSAGGLYETTDNTTTHAAGRFVWHDLVTHDLEAVRTFYAQLFGWEFEQAAPRDGHPYLLAKLDGNYVAGIVELPRPGNGTSYARWLGYMTVDDIDQAIITARAQSGKVAIASRDLGEVGTVAAISDAQGAVLGLVQTRLDPDELPLNGHVGAVVWDELLATDSHMAAGFYKALTGVDATTIERRGGEYIMLNGSDKPRAGILQNPFSATDPLWLSYFGAGNPAAATNRAQSLGGKVILAPSENLREGSMAILQDPGGAIFALQKWPL